ncbi:MAG TPA: Rrf2 family transcriptional regulator [Myxococcota bacterium]|nr:Rrf2 family transcriptional regulator [Myxococcota bacterium]
MLRIRKITDYGIVLLTELARGAPGEPHAARELSEAVALPMPVVSKTLKALARRGLLVSHRGARGGFSLAREPERIAVSEVIDAFEGPVGLTECTIAGSECQREAIYGVIVQALRQVTVADLIAPPAALVDFTLTGAPAASSARKTH